MRVRAFHLERDDRPLVRRIANDAQRVDLPKSLVGVFDQSALMPAYARLADRIEVLDRRREPNGLDNGRSRGSELEGALPVGDAILKNLVDHLAAAVERRYRFKMLMFAVERADAGRPINLETGENIKVAADVAYIHIHVHGRLRPIDQNRN